jgi:hypothetical protein
MEIGLWGFSARAGKGRHIMFFSEVRRSLGIGIVVGRGMKNRGVMLEAMERPVEKLVRLVTDMPSSEDLGGDQLDACLLNVWQGLLYLS